jgi:uncharacterized membrane protein YraQ (UPF0718 family)
MKRRRRVDANLWILLGLTLAALAVAFARSPELPLAGLRSSARLLGNVWLELALGFALAGLFDVLVSQQSLVRWLGEERSGRGILIAWVVGLLIPGGPYVFFPVAASLFAKGVSAGALITLITAKTLVSPIRMLTYEAPLVGWPLTLARFIPGILLPPVVGVVGQWLFRIFQLRGAP